jgi:hypothetical protein
MPEFVIVQVDDWAALYVDGVKEHEGHSIPLFELAQVGAIDELRGLDGTPFEQTLIEHGRMPERLEDVPRG